MTYFFPDNLATLSDLPKIFVSLLGCWWTLFPRMSPSCTLSFFFFLAILQYSQAVLRRLSPYGIEIALSTLIFFVSDSDSSKLNGQQMVELKRGSTELKELLSGNDAAENDDVDEEFEINVYGQR